MCAWGYDYIFFKISDTFFFKFSDARENINNKFLVIVISSDVLHVPSGYIYQKLVFFSCYSLFMFCLSVPSILVIFAFLICLYYLYNYNSHLDVDGILEIFLNM